MAMGLFDRRQPEPDPIPEPQPQPRPQQAAPQQQPRPQPQPEQAQVAPQPKPAAKPVPQPSFGIQRAIELMRKLPPENIELVVSVVKTTLESAQVDVESIIEDAVGRRRKISDRIDGLRSEIKDFEEEIEGRKTEIAALERDYSETTDVQEKLELALDLSEASERTQIKKAAPKRPAQKAAAPAQKAAGTPQPRRAQPTPAQGVPKATIKKG